MERGAHVIVARPDVRAVAHQVLHAVDIVLGRERAERDVHLGQDAKAVGHARIIALQMLQTAQQDAQIAQP
eukprot:1644687-Rhodomonas_salina.3